MKSEISLTNLNDNISWNFLSENPVTKQKLELHLFDIKM